MLGLLTSRRIMQDQRPPEYPWALNEDCEQAQGLVGFWPLGYEAFNERDAKASKYDLAQTNGPSIDRDGIIGPYRSFTEASSQKLEAGQAVLTAVPITVAAWMRTTSIAAVVRPIVHFGTAASDNYFALFRFTASVDVRVNDGGGSSVASQSAGLTANNWHHAAGVFLSATSRTAYRDGIAGTTETTSKTPTGINNFAVGFRLSVGTYFDGRIAHVCVYNVGKVSDEIRRMNDPETRWELYYPVGRKTWSFAPTGGATFVGRGLTRSNLLSGRSLVG